MPFPLSRIGGDNLSQVWSNSSASFTGPFGTVPQWWSTGPGIRWQPVIDFSGSFNVMRMFRSADSGTTWTESNAAGAPGSAGFQQTAVFDGARFIYVLYFKNDGGGVTSDHFFLAIAAFDTQGNGGLGTWGAPVVSNLPGARNFMNGHVPPLPATDAFQESLCAVYRPSDGSVFACFAISLGTAVIPDPTQINYPGGTAVLQFKAGAWIGTADYRSMIVLDFNGGSGLPGSAAVDSNNTLHLIYQIQSNPASLLHTTMSSGNAPGGVQTIRTIGPLMGAALIPRMGNIGPLTIDAAGVMKTTYGAFPGSMAGGNDLYKLWSLHVLRSDSTGAAPNWEDTTPLATHPHAAQIAIGGNYAGVASIGGNDYLFYGYSDSVNATYEYVTSPGRGQGWSASMGVGSVAAAKGSFDVSGGNGFWGGIQSILQTFTGSAILGFTFPYSPTVLFSALGVGYFEAPAVPGVVTAPAGDPRIPLNKIQLIPLPVRYCCIPLYCKCKNGSMMQRGKVILL